MLAGLRGAGLRLYLVPVLLHLSLRSHSPSMSPSAKKRPRNSVVSKMPDENPQDKIRQPVSIVNERSRLKMVLRNLSLLRLLKSSKPRIEGLHNLARRCWNSLLRVQKVLLSSSRNNTVCGQVDQNSEEPQEARYSKKTLESKKSESTEKSREGLQARKKAQQSHAAVPDRGQAGPDVPQTSRGHGGLSTGREPWRRQLPTGNPGVVTLKTHHRDTEQREAADRWTWCEGLPRRIHLPGPRVMCRSSSLRWVKRCCTRFCSTSLELPACRPHRV